MSTSCLANRLRAVQFLCSSDRVARKASEHGERERESINTPTSKLCAFRDVLQIEFS